jgi:hypothetical protein
MGNLQQRSQPEPVEEWAPPLVEVIAAFEAKEAALLEEQEACLTAALPLPNCLGPIVFQYFAADLAESLARSMAPVDRSHRTRYEYCLKVCLVGEPRVGKTRFLHHLNRELWGTAGSLRRTARGQIDSATYEPTIGVDFIAPVFTFANKVIKLQVWDTAGSPNATTKGYMRSTFASLLFFQRSDRVSFDAARSTWFAIVKDYQKPMVLVALTSAEPGDEEVSLQEASEWAAARNSPCVVVKADGSGDCDVCAAIAAALRRYAETDIWRHRDGDPHMRVSEVLYPD